MEIIIPLVSLIALEVILGIDNIIFISILANKLPENQKNKLRYWGIGLAMLMRLGLLAFISWILKLDQTLFSAFSIAFTGKGLILILGGMFLLYKSTKEIYRKTEELSKPEQIITKKADFKTLLAEIIILDLVFSVDSIITAVGMVNQLWIMYTAVITTVIIMLLASKHISDFITKHPSFKILALCFLMIIGMSLIAEGFHFEIPKGYIYFSMAFAFLVDIIQLKTIQKTIPVVIFLISFSGFSQETTFSKIEDALKNPSLVKRLDLSNQKINFNVTDLSIFKNLEYLSLKNEHLKKLPPQIGKLENLKILDLSGNEFSELPSEYKNLKNLKAIFLNEDKNLNLYQNIEVLKLLPHLQVIHLEKNDLKELPPNFNELKHLESLYLNENQFKSIPKIINGLDHLQYLNLEKNKIKNDNQTIMPLNFGVKIKL
ncbi:MAG: hypothetical protein QM535_00465 [Limnohabitans sp.]|nr:hypothetical protein [Limnohabitans sp.]